MSVNFKCLYSFFNSKTTTLDFGIRSNYYNEVHVSCTCSMFMKQAYINVLQRQDLNVSKHLTQVRRADSNCYYITYCIPEQCCHECSDKQGEI